MRLREACVHDEYADHGWVEGGVQLFCSGSRPLTDAEALRTLLPNVDVDELRKALSVPHLPIEEGSCLSYRVDHVTDFIDNVARAVLDALGGSDG
jgi:hypothetical protein